MKKQILLLTLFFLFTDFVNSQTTYSWLSGAENGQWNNNQNWSDGSNTTNVGFGILSFNNNNQTSMTNNFVSTFDTYRIYFESGSSDARTINNGTVRLFDNSGDNPMISNNSAATHVMNFALQGDGDAADPLIIEINSTGGLTFGGAVNNQGSVINIEGSTTTATQVLFNGIISGGGGLYKANSNITLTLAGNNTFTGQTTIDAGTIEVTGGLGATDIRIGLNGHLDLQSSVSVPSVAERGTSDGGTIAIGSSATLTINGADKGDLYQNTISGAGNLILNASGNTRLDLYGDNTFTGLVTVSGGTLRVSHQNGLGTTDAGTTVNNGGVLELNAASDYPAEALVLNGTGINFGGALRKTSTGTQEFHGSITLNSNTRINNDAGTLDIRGDLHLGSHTLYIGTSTSMVMGAGSLIASGADKTTDDGAIFKDGSSFFVLRPSAQLTGSITLKEGEIRISTGTNIPEGGTFIIHGGTILSSDAATTRTVEKDISLLGDFTLANNSSGGVNIDGGIDLNGALRNIAVVNNSVISGVISNGSLTKSGSGTLTLTGNSTYAGATAVVEGILELQGNLASSDVTVANGATLKINGDNVELAGLTIQSGGIVEILSGKSLTVSGTLTNSAGASGLVIKSDATGTGSLIHSSTGVQATVERYLSNYDNNDDQKYHFISSPVATQAIRPDWVANTPAADVDFYKYDELTNQWINTKTEDDMWNTEFENDFVVGRGYLVAYPTAPVTKSFTGTLNSGSFTTGSGGFPALTHTTDQGNGWNLIGNPYPSAIDWTQLTLGDGVDNALYYYDAAAENYRYYLQLDDIGSLGGGSQYIPAMQGFMVHAKTTGTQTITFENDDRTHSGQDNFYKSTNNVPGSFSLNVSAEGYQDELYVHFSNGATAAFDGKYDAYKLWSYNQKVPKLYTKSSNGDNLAINGLPELTEDVDIPVFFVPGVEGGQVLTADLSNLSAILYLTDLKTGITQNLYNNPVYEFSADINDDPNRFLLKFTSVGIEDVDNYNKSINIYTYNNSLYLNSDITMDASVEIFNLTGQQVYGEQVLMNGLTQINPNLRTGWYVVKVSTDEGMASEKVFIK
jgi:autotransporter-associated beta strand protein